MRKVTTFRAILETKDCFSKGIMCEGLDAYPCGGVWRVDAVLELD